MWTGVPVSAPKPHQIRLTAPEQEQYQLLCSSQKFRQYKDPKKLFMDMVVRSLQQVVK